MVDLYNHRNPLFTTWVVANGFLDEPFVILDIGFASEALDSAQRGAWASSEPEPEVC
jgi:hypothetical protein